MRQYRYILYILIILQSVTVNSGAKYLYGRPVFDDRSLRELEDPETYQAEYGNSAPRFRKYHSNYRYRPSRSGRERHSGRSVDYERERAYYDGAGRENDPSIEVIVDPGKKKAVAVIENGPAGQSRYELTGYEMAKEFKEPEVQQHSANLDNPAGKTERKRNQNIADSNADNANYEYNETVAREKQKRNAELTKRKINKASKMSQAPLKQDYTDDQVGALPTKRKSSEDSKEETAAAAENCPPHLEEQVKDQKRNEQALQQQKENDAKNSVKREVANAFSESQLNTLSDSVAKLKDSGEDVENLKRVLFDMGLVQNYKRDAESSANDNMEKQQTKRDLQQGQTEDEDMSKDNIVMKRNSEASDEQGWDDDGEEELDEQMDKRDAESDNWEDEEEVDEGVADEPVDNMKHGTGDLAEAKMNEDNAKETANAAVPMRDKRQNKENQEENAEENQNEMIDNYAKELQQTNLEAAARNKREQDKNKTKQSKDNKKRSDKEEDKLIKEAESQGTPDSKNADDTKKLTKRENAKETSQESDATKKKMESEIKEKIQMIKDKVKREILEENVENSRDNYRKSANFQRDVRAADSLDLDGSFKRSKRDLSGSPVNTDHDENLNKRDLLHYALNRRTNTDGNVTKIAIDYKRNQTSLPTNDSKALDPIIESDNNLKPIIRQQRAVNATDQAKILETTQGIVENENDKHSDVNWKAKELPPAVRKRRDVAQTAEKEIEEHAVIRQKRANGDPEKQMVYEPFQNGEVDETEEEGEFGDNYNDGRLYIDKRQARNEEEYFEEPQQQQYEERDATYFDGEHNPGRRRRSFEDADNARIANGAEMRSDYREKREPLDGDAKLTDDEEYNENLYFGPLSKTYNEDLVRYKRVKRDKP